MDNDKAKMGSIKQADTEYGTSEADLKNFLETVDYRVARSREELESAYYLVYKEYLKRGYVKESSSKAKISIFNALPQTVTFVAVFENNIFATVTIIPDSPLGLPMDEVYHEELMPFRQRNKKLCEISMLASETELFKGGMSLMLNAKKMFFIFYLFKLVFDYAREFLKLDCLCITINPKHSLTYEFLLFKDMGGLKAYNSVNGAPALAKYIELPSIENECRMLNKEGLIRMFFGKVTPAEKFARRVIMNEQDLKFFFVERTDIFKNATAAQMNHLKKCYPAYDFSEIIR